MKYLTPSHMLFTMACVLIMGRTLPAEAADPPTLAPLPVTLRLDKPGYVTAVIERADGRRVGNLVSEAKAQAGALTLNWDLYDVGVRKGEKEPYVRTLVEPGIYRVRGLVHDGLDLRYEFSVYSPGQPSWKTDDTSGAWMGDHAPPSDCLFLPHGPDGKPGLVLATPCSESVLLSWLTEKPRSRGAGFVSVSPRSNASAKNWRQTETLRETEAVARGFSFLTSPGTSSPASQER